MKEQAMERKIIVKLNRLLPAVFLTIAAAGCATNDGPENYGSPNSSLPAHWDNFASPNYLPPACWDNVLGGDESSPPVTPASACAMRRREA